MAGPSWDDLAPAPPAALGGATSPNRPILTGHGLDEAVNARVRQLTAPPAAPSADWERLSPTPPAAADGDSLGDTAYKALGWDPKQGILDNMLGTASWKKEIHRDKALVGLGDPNDRGLDAQGNPVAPGGEAHLSADRPGLWDRVKSVADDTIHHSLADAAARWAAGYLPSTEDYDGTPGADNSQAALQARAKARITQAEIDRRAQYAGQSADDPWYRPGDIAGNVARGGADLAGMLGGGIISDPTNLVAPGKSLLTKMLAQGGIGMGVDLATQGVEKAQGVRKEVDPIEAAISGGAGALQVGVLEGVPALRNWWKARGANVDAVPDEALVAGSLDGTIGGSGMTREQVQGIMQGAGSDMGQFSSPEAAAAAAARVQEVQGRTAPNLSTGMPAGIGSKALGNYLDVATPARRVVPDDVTMIAAPEGTIRSDDPGAMVGVDRKRAADRSVLADAQNAARNDPAMAEVLAADIPTQTKVAVSWDKLSTKAPDRPLPHTAPTADQAAAPRAQSFMDKVRAKESGGNDNAHASTSSAAGRYQFTDATWLQNYKEKFGQDRPDAEILARKGDGALQDTLMRNLTARNARELRAAGHTDDDGNLYLAHFLGRGGAIKVLGADPHTPMVNLVGADAVKANRSILENKSAGDVIAWAHNKMGESAPSADAPWRMSAPQGEDINGVYSGRTRPVEGRDAFGRPKAPDAGMGDYERSGARTSPTDAQREAGVAADLDAPAGVGGSDRLFKATSDDPAGAPGFWEGRADQMHQEAFAKAQSDLEAEWKAREDARAEREASKGAGERMERERVRGEEATKGDPSQLYRGKYDQKPVKRGDFWHTTEEGFVAGAGEKPVAFRSAKEAATWAAKNQMGGDFELHTWATNNKRVVLRRREGSTYGEPVAPSPAEPFAGRSTDASQRLVGGPRDETRGLASGSETVHTPAQGEEGALASPPSPTNKPSGERQAGEGAIGASSPKPVDALTFIARNGGLRNDEGHALRKGGREMAQFAPGGGHLFRRDGMSIDRAGELLHEAGYFNGERPTTAEVLDLLHRSEFERQYRPEDVADVHAREQDPETEAHAREQLRAVAAEHGHDLPAADEGRMLDLVAAGHTPHEAYRAHHEEQIFNALDAMQREAGDQGYDFHDDPVGQDARGGTAGTERPARVGGDEGAGTSEPRGSEPQGQRDAFGTRPGDERASLERQGEGRSRSDATQKAPGSDGGLFDGGRDRELLRKDGDAPGGKPETRRMADVVRKVGDTAKNKRHVELARALEPLMGDLEAKVGRFSDDQAGNVTDRGSGPLEVHLRDTGEHETVLHEAIHVAAMSRYGDLTKGTERGKPGFAAVEKLNSLRDRALKAYREAHDPTGEVGRALENTDEFLAYGLTNPAFQKWLQGRSTAGLWGRFVDGVRELLGLAPKYADMLGDVLRSGSDLIGKARKVEPFTGSLERAPVTRAAHDPVDPKEPGPAGWKRVAGLVFEDSALEHDGPAMAAAVKAVYGDPKAALQGAGDRLKKFGETVFYSADSAARSLAGRFNAPTIAKFADLFHAEAGKMDRAVDRTYTEAVAHNANKYLNDIHGALKPHVANKEAMGRIRDLLATPTSSVRATVAEREAAGKVRDVLNELLEYRRDAGEPIGDVRDGYFPRVTRFDKVAANPEGFRRAAEKVYREAGHEHPVEAADALMVHAINGSMNISDAVAFGGGGKPSSSKAREFGKSADVHLREFYETNPMRALADYAASAVKRAEEARRFGKVGREGSPERAAWEKEHGDKTRWDVMKRQIQDELRTNGADARGVMERIESIRGTNLGHTSPGEMKAGAAISVIHAWNQLGTLAQSMFASLPELAMGFVRGGPRYGFTHLSTTFSEFARNVRKLPASDARRYAEAAGAVGSDTAVDLMRARADDPGQNVAVQRLLHSFYRKNGLEQWTDAGRTAAVKTGQRFVDALAHDLVSSSARTKVRAAGYLRELGVKDPEAFGAQLRNKAPSLEDMRADNGFARDYSTALLRFANQSVLMPTRAVKPTWASHPLGSLLFALQSYNYAFKKNVLDRIGRETLASIKERDPNRLAAAGGLVVLTGVTAMVQALRHTIYGTPNSQEEETPMHYALETLDRTGIFGAASPLLNAFQGLRYKRSVGQVLQGSVIGRASQAADAIGGLAVSNSENTDTAERKAAGAIYDMVVRPTVNAVGAGVLKGAAGSAVILGTGGRDNGLVVNDKSKFQEAVAGPDEMEDEE
jgi:hypothetical protein